MTLPTRSDLATVQLWNTITGKPGPKFQGPTQALVALGFMSDGRQVRAVYDGKVLFWGVPAQAKAIQAALSTAGQVGLPGTKEEQPFGEELQMMAGTIRNASTIRNANPTRDGLLIY